MKKLLSLLLVGVVAVSMFGFIRPNRVNAAEVDINSRPSGIVTIESRAKFLSRICATVSKDSKYEQIIRIDPTQPSFRSPSTNSFCVPESKNKINLDFSVYSSNGRRRSIVRISVKFYKQEKLRQNSNSKKEVEIISIKIEKNASVHVDSTDGWTVMSQQYMETQ